MSKSDLEATGASSSSSQQGEGGGGRENVAIDLTLYEFKEQLLLLSTLVSTVTYVAGLNLPGGSWEQDDPGGHIAGDPILRDLHYHRYLAFYYCNVTAFAASLVVTLILIILKKKDHEWTVVLRMVMVLDLLSLIVSYGAGSCRDSFTTIFALVAFCVLVISIIVVFLSYLWKNGANEAQSSSHSNSNSISHSNSNHRSMFHVLMARARGLRRTRILLEVLRPQAKKKDKEKIDVLMALASFAVTITYIAGLSPPGGFWSRTQDGHQLSDPVLQARGRFRAFFFCNTTSFVLSLFVIVFLLEKMMLGEEVLFEGLTWFRRKKVLRLEPIKMRLAAAYWLIAVALVGLMGAYAAGSCRAAGNTVVVLTIPVCAFLLLAFVLLRGQMYLDAIRSWFNDILGGTGHTGTTYEIIVLLRNFTRSLVTLLAILVVSITYQAGLDPPGGLWQEDRDGHKMGHPVLQTTHPTRYKVFFYSNSTAFVTSMVIIMLIQNKLFPKRWIVEATLVLDLFGLITAYVAGSTRDINTSIYIMAMVAGVFLVYVIVHITFKGHDPEPEGDSTVTNLDDKRKMMLLVAILATTLTYQAGLTPPGGFWLADDQGHGRRAGFPVLLHNYPRRYNTFIYCNAASFMASVTLILLLMISKLHSLRIRSSALYVCMLVGMIGLMGAYAAGSSRHLKTSIYVVTLVVAVLAFIALLLLLFWLLSKVDHSSRNTTTTSNNNNNTTVTTATTTTTTTDNITTSNNNNKNTTTTTATNNTTTTDSITNTNKIYGDTLDLMLLGILGASMTYPTGMKPPGGLWQDNKHGHSAGNPILHDIDKHRYNTFFYGNSTSFMASIVVVVMLLPLKITKKFQHRNPPFWAMNTTILLGMLSLLEAYIAGCTR